MRRLERGISPFSVDFPDDLGLVAYTISWSVPSPGNNIKGDRAILKTTAGVLFGFSKGLFPSPGVSHYADLHQWQRAVRKSPLAPGELSSMHKPSKSHGGQAHVSHPCSSLVEGH